MQIGNVIQRAPKWAIYGAGGVIAVGGAYQLLRRRAEAATGEATVQGDTQAPLGLAPSPAPGIVVPPVILPNQPTDNFAGVQSLQDLYIGAVNDVTSAWKDVASGWSDVAGEYGRVYQPVLSAVMGQNQTLITGLQGQNNTLIGFVGQSFVDTNAALLAIAQAGPAPAPAAVAPTPVFAGDPSPAPAAPAPAAPPPSCPGAYPNGTFPDCWSHCAHNECHCEGTGASRKCWTRRDTAHCHSDGRRVHMTYEFVRNGC